MERSNNYKIKRENLDRADFCLICNKTNCNGRNLIQMKKYGNVVLFLILILVPVLAGCSGGNGGGGNSGGGRYTGVAFTMVPVPTVTNFPIGTDDNTDNPGSVTNPYYIAQTEVTYELWKAVYDWATDPARANRYYFQNAGVEGSMGTVGADPTTANNQHPVTNVSWRDAMVWCNALTEYYAAKGGTSLACVYTYNGATVRDSRDSNVTACDSVAANIAANGFRLPTGNEWELAARYISATKFYPGNYASGADAACNATATADYDGDNYKHNTSDVAVYDNSSTAAVKSKSPNKLGLYDMSGNVWEWCFDLHGDNDGIPLREVRGESWHYFDIMNEYQYLQLGFKDICNSDWFDSEIGFRPVRTQ